MCPGNTVACSGGAHLLDHCIPLRHNGSYVMEKSDTVCSISLVLILICSKTPLRYKRLVVYAMFQFHIDNKFKHVAMLDLFNDIF